MPTSKQRHAAERRRLQRQAERRQQQQLRHRRANVIASIVGTLVIIVVVVTLIAVTNGADSKPKSTATAPRTTSSAPASKTPSATPSASTPAASSSAATSSTQSSTATTTSCRYPRSGTAARRVSTPSTTAIAEGTVTVRLTTSQGIMTFALNRAAAPCAVNSFVSLARQKYYDNTSCHRLVTKSIFLLQCGDPTATGSGGPGYRFADELGKNPVYRRGSVVMANAGPNTNGSQFYIVDRDTTLGAGFTRLGTVSAGLDVLDTVYRAGTSDKSSDGPPKLHMTFRTVSVG